MVNSYYAKKSGVKKLADFPDYVPLNNNRTMKQNPNVNHANSNLKIENLAAGRVTCNNMFLRAGSHFLNLPNLIMLTIFLAFFLVVAHIYNITVQPQVVNDIIILLNRCSPIFVQRYLLRTAYHYEVTLF